MEIKFTQTANKEKNIFSDDITGYYLISVKWSMVNDPYITFIRKNALAYCYNVNWAGPLTKFEIDRVYKNEQAIIVSHDTIKHYLEYVNNVWVLPNTDELRNLIGLKETGLLFAN
ncbi:MAG: hypothetical protein QG594_1238 [Bacteroidota bacterium]|nr:hypothetical protein [Bacteroidota bacterium]